MSFWKKHQPSSRRGRPYSLFRDCGCGGSKLFGIGFGGFFGCFLATVLVNWMVRERKPLTLTE
jgi:hypothetical protein